MVVGATHPQPPWSGAEEFIASYHPIQLFPYLAGFILVSGFVYLMAALHQLGPDTHRSQTGAALVFTAVFAAMVFSNYAIQTTVVPSLLGAASRGEQAVLSVLTMSNPTSLGWGLEMWGYAALGLATWLVSPVLDGAGPERVARSLYVVNGPISVLGGVVTAIVPGWVLTGPGLIAFAGWNGLVIVMMALTVYAMNRRRRAA